MYSNAVSSCHGSILITLPEHLIDSIAVRLAGGSRKNFSVACRAFNEAVKRHAQHVDLYELCGWGDGCTEVPVTALLAAEQCPHAQHVTLPSGWRDQGIKKLLTHAAACTNTWRQLSSIAMHFQALNPRITAAVAQLVPGVTKLTLSLDLAFEQTKRQAWRTSSLQQMTGLQSLVLQVDLRPEALQVLSGLPRLRNLQLTSSSTMSHSAASLAALISLTGLTALRFDWQAGRTLPDARLVRDFSNNLQKLEVWLSAGHRLPPCSSTPLPGLMAALGTLTSLTSLQLLQGLYMSWDLRTISQLAGLKQLQVLGLHDSVVSECELALLAPCTALSTLKVDAIKLHAVNSSAGEAAAAAAAAGPEHIEFEAGHAAYLAAAAAPATGIQDPVDDSSPVQPHLVTLGRLQHLEVNMFKLGLWTWDELCPDLQTLTPLECTLGAKGHGVVWDLGAIEGHPKLQTLGLMFGALGTTINYNASCNKSDSAETIAAAVLRVILQSAGINRMGGTPCGCSMRQLLKVVTSLPNLKQLQLWGHAGGASGRLLASTHRPQLSLSRESVVYMSSAASADAACCANSPNSYRMYFGSLCSSCSSSSRCSSHGEASSSSTAACCFGPGSAATGSPLERTSSNSSSASSAVGDLLRSVGALLSPRSSTRTTHAAAVAATTALPAPAFAADHGLLGRCRSHADRVENEPGLDLAGASNQQTSHEHQHHPTNNPCADMQGIFMQTSPRTRQKSVTIGHGPGAACCSCHVADHQVVTRLLEHLPQLEVLQLVRCEFLAQGGMQLAAECCSKFGPAVEARSGSK